MDQTERTNLEAAQAAFLQLKNEAIRLQFVNWCRVENDKLLFHNIKTATDEGLNDSKEVLSQSLDKAKAMSAIALEAGKEVLDGLRKGTDKLTDSMRDFLGEKKP